MLAHHPFVTDVAAEQEEIKQEKRESMDSMIDYQHLAGDTADEPTEQ